MFKESEDEKKKAWNDNCPLNYDSNKQSYKTSERVVSWSENFGKFFEKKFVMTMVQ